MKYYDVQITITKYYNVINYKYYGVINFELYSVILYAIYHLKYKFKWLYVNTKFLEFSRKL